MHAGRTTGLPNTSPRQNLLAGAMLKTVHAAQGHRISFHVTPKVHRSPRQRKHPTAPPGYPVPMYYPARTSGCPGGPANCLSLAVSIVGLGFTVNKTKFGPIRTCYRPEISFCRHSVSPDHGPTDPRLITDPLIYVCAHKYGYPVKYTGCVRGAAKR